MAPPTPSPPLVLSTVGPPQAGVGPRLDVLELAATLGAEILYPGAGRGPFSLVERRMPRLGLWGEAQEVRRRRPPVAVSLSEKIGMAVELFSRGTVPQVVVAHRLTTARRRQYERATRWLHRVDHVVVLSRAQEAYLRDEVGLPPARISFVRDKVDHRFWQTQGEAEEGYVLAVGQTGRDYDTFLEAVRPLGVRVLIVRSSLWQDRADATPELPANVEILSGLSFTELRRLYDRASVVAVPLPQGSDYAAGVNAALEAMAMGKPLVVSDVPGLAGYFRDGVDALLVPPGDPRALGAAINGVLDRSAAARSLGTSARAVIDRGLNLDTYVEHIAGIATALQ